MAHTGTAGRDLRYHTAKHCPAYIKNIYADNELTDEATHKKYLLVRQEGAGYV